MADDEDRIIRLTRIAADRRAAQAAANAPTLASRMQLAADRRDEQRERMDKAALDRPRNATDERLDDAVAQGDLRRLASMAEQGIIEPNDARLAADIVKYDHPENRTRSVWLADRAKTAARYPDRMDDIVREARYTRTSDAPTANPEVSHRILDAVIDKSFDFLLSFDWDAPVEQPQPHPEPEPDRPIERLAQRIRM